MTIICYQCYKATGRQIVLNVASVNAEKSTRKRKFVQLSSSALEAGVAII